MISTTTAPEENTAAIQSIVDGGGVIELPSGTIQVASPILYDSSLVVRGVCGARYRPQSSVIRANFAGPIFKKRGSTFDPIAWRLTTDNQQCTVDFDSVVVENVHQFGSGLEIHHARCPSRVTNSTFMCRFQGLSVFGSFNTLIQNCFFSGGFFRHWTWADKQMAEVAWGLMLNGHGTINACDVVGWGTGVKLTGIQCNVESLRVEINGYGMHIGGRAANNGAQIEPLRRSVISAISMEANCHNMYVENISHHTRIQCVEGQGSTNAQNGLTEKGLEVLNCGDTCKIESVGMFGNFRDYAVKMQSKRNTNAVIGNIASTQSVYTDRHSEIKRHLLSGVVSVSAGSTQAQITFPDFPKNTAANFQLSTEGTADGEPVAVTYGVAIESPFGQTNVAGRMKQKVDVANGQNVVVGFWSQNPPAGCRRKIYKFGENEQVLGFWYYDNGKRFVDAGQPFDGRDFPSERHLPDQSFAQQLPYTVEIEPCGVACSVSNQTPQGFVLQFSEPLAADAEIKWALSRVEA